MGNATAQTHTPTKLSILTHSCRPTKQIPFKYKKNHHFNVSISLVLTV